MAFETSSFAVDPNAALLGSPLWPLQSALRTFFAEALQSGDVDPVQAARVTPVQGDVEMLFLMWEHYPSLNFLRAQIRAMVAPPQLDLTGSATLSYFQSQLLSLPQWNDQLPS